MLRRFLSLLLISLLLVTPAAAHKLKVFAAVEGDQISGYAFFIGGGRAMETPWVAKQADGTVIAKGNTDSEGRYSLTAPQPVTSDITVTVNTEEGHIAKTVLAASRFGVAENAALAVEVAQTDPAASPPAVKTAPAASSTASPLAAALVEAAVQRQVEPLLERIEQMDDRLRYSDILSGIFLIIGLAGIGLWARGLKK